MKGKVPEAQLEDEDDDLTARQSAPSCPPHPLPLACALARACALSHAVSSA